MGTVRKIGKEYYIEFHARGLLYQQKAGGDLGAAKRMLREVESKIQKGEMGIIARDVDRDIFFETYLEYAKNEFDPRTFRRYASVARHFDGFCAGQIPKLKKLSEVTPRVIENYRDSLVKEGAGPLSRIKPNIINFTLYLLKDILGYAITLGYLNDNPALHARMVSPRGGTVPITLTARQIERIFKHSSDDLKDIVEVVLRSGIRIEELVRLKWTMVDPENKSITIEPLPGSSGAARRERVIPMDHETEVILSRFKMKNDYFGQGCVFVEDNGRPFDQELLKKDLRQAAHDAGIERSITFNNFRSTFAWRILNKGISVVGLYRLLGLSDIAKVMRYVILREAQNDLEEPSGRRLK